MTEKLLGDWASRVESHGPAAGVEHAIVGRHGAWRIPIPASKGRPGLILKAQRLLESAAGKRRLRKNRNGGSNEERSKDYLHDEWMTPWKEPGSIGQGPCSSRERLREITPVNPFGVVSEVGRQSTASRSRQ